DRHRDPVALARERLVDRVVDDLEHQVVEAALAGVPDVHAGALPDGFKALQDLDVSGPVGVGRRLLRRVHYSPTQRSLRMLKTAAGRNTVLYSPTARRATSADQKSGDLAAAARVASASRRRCTRDPAHRARSPVRPRR